MAVTPFDTIASASTRWKKTVENGDISLRECRPVESPEPLDTMMKHSLLDESLLRVRLSSDDSEPRALALPEVLHILSREEEPHLLSFEALQAHQRQAWYSFLVQLAAMAVAQGDSDGRPESPDGWRRALLNLSEEDEAPWHLVVSDVKRPAFVQSPVSEEEESLDDAGYKTVAEHRRKGERSLDSFEPLLTSKNHSVKRQRVTSPKEDHWVYALCNTQTMSGYVNYYQRIVRVSGGYSSRPFLGLSSNLKWGERFRRDLRVLRSERQNLTKYNLSDGHTLLWTIPWSGQKGDGIPLYECDPFFIEVSRRIRLVEPKPREIAYRKATNPGMRIEEPTDDLEGDTGDVWTPIESDGSALRVIEDGFDYRCLDEVLLGSEYERPPALQFREGEDGLMYVVAEALGRGQGKTHGLHRRIVPIPQEVTNRLGRGTLLEELAERSRKRIRMTDTVSAKVLYSALTTLLLAGSDQTSDEEDPKQKELTKSRKEVRFEYLDAFKSSIDTLFFELLWESAKEEVSDKEAKRQWQTLLWKKAKQQFEDAQRHAPRSAVHYWRARSAAQSMFRSQANRYLEDAEQATF
jgi:CRISPR system Cascade subunit CasA